MALIMRCEAPRVIAQVDKTPLTDWRTMAALQYEQPPCLPTRFTLCLSALPTYTLPNALSAELEIRKSRFIGYAIPVADRDAAMHELRCLRETHPAATHVCWALLASGQSGMSDDGEPSGTAGRPILEVLRHHDLDGVLAAVVRYYGGVKLGAGGLVRAYTDAIASVLQDAPRVERIALATLTVEISYPDEARIRRWIEQQNYALENSAYGMDVALAIRMPVTALEDARNALRDLTQGRAVFPPNSAQGD
jgi:uncharacterized YigZ family protein